MIYEYRYTAYGKKVDILEQGTREMIGDCPITLHDKLKRFIKSKYCSCELDRVVVELIE